MTHDRTPLGTGLVALLVLAGCASTSPAPTTSNRPRVARPVQELDSRIKRDGSVTFRSWGGQWIGKCCDTDITFLPGRAMHMTVYGYVPAKYEGTYRIDAGGEVTAMFSGYRPGFPAILLRKDAASLLLLPKKDSDEVQGWPFRPLPTRRTAAAT